MPSSQKQYKAPKVSPLAQRFADAVRTLIGDGPIKQRLSRAYAAYLEDLADSEFPAALRRDFGELQAALNRIAPVGNETRIRASVQKMSPDEAASHAATIVKLYVELLNTLERAEPLKVVSTPKKPPHFLTSRS
jgi:hypothetical protein